MDSGEDRTDRILYKSPLDSEITDDKWWQTGNTGFAQAHKSMYHNLKE